MVKFRNLALVIGINEYRNDPRIAPLTTARFDAIKFTEILKRDYDYDVELLTDDQQQATYDGIQDALARLPERIYHAHQQAEKVRLIFYFAGHGISSQGTLEEAGFLAAQDSEVEQLRQFLSMKDLHDKLTALDCHHALIILDCCFAGAFKFITRHLGFRRTPEEITKERYQRYEKSAAWQVLVSAAHDQKALDITLDNRGVVNSDREQPNSPFAAALFRAIDKTILADDDCTPADYTKDGITTATELFVFLDREMEQNIGEFSHQQVPRFWPLSKHDKGEFFFETGEFDFNRLPDTPELSPENNPYRGLESFDEAQQRFFFGREELVKELQAYVDRDHHPFTVVLGVSGSGKSSLVKAGLIPQLRRLQASPWQILTPMRPGLSPLKALAKVLLSLEQQFNPDEFQQLEQLTENLKNARKRSPDDKALTQLLAEWRRNDLGGKLRLIVTEFEQWQQIVDGNQQQLGQLRQAGLHRSGLVLENLEELKPHCSPQEQQALEEFYQHYTTQIEFWSQQWQHHPEHLCKLIAQWCDKHASHRLLLVIDQFEELITQSQESERDAFLVCLRSILQNFPQQLRVVATLRADFESRFVDNEQLQDFWQLESRFFVRPMRRDEFRQVIEGPAQDYVLSFGANDKKYSLVDQLIDEVELMPGGLPLLSFTLSELYREYVKSDRNDRTLSWDDYRNLNGVTGSLTRRATDEYKTLDEQHQTTMRWVMLRMVTFEGGETARRRVFDSELIYPTQEESNLAKQVVNQLVNARLLVGGQLENGESYVEPAHDYLVRGWGLLQDWINEEKAKETLELQQRLTAQANDWARNQGPLLPDGDRLDRLEKILKSHNSWLNLLERKLIQFSINYRELQHKQAKELRAKSVIREKSVRVANLINVKPLESLVLAIQSAGQNLDELPNEILSEMQSSLNRAMIDARVPNTFQGHESEVTSIAFSPNGEVIASGSADKTIRLWDLQGNPINKPLIGHESEVTSIAFSPNGEVIASGSADKTIRLWNLQGNPINKPLIGHESEVTSIAFSPNGEVIASGSADKTIRLWNLQEHSNDRLLSTTEVGEVLLLTFDLNGEQIISCHFPWLLCVWDDQGNLVNQHQIVQNSGFTSLAFNPNRQTLITCEHDNKLRLWDMQGSLIGQPFIGHDHHIMSVTFSPDGEKILSGSRDKTVRLWDLHGNLLCLPLRHEEQVCLVTFSPTGQNIISCEYDGKIHIWDWQGNSLGKPFVGHQSSVNSAVFSLDQKIIISGSDDQRVLFWDYQGNLVGETPQHDGRVTSVAVSSDGRFIASGGWDCSISIWDFSGNRIGYALQGHEDIVNSIAFNRNNELIASGSRDCTIRLWDLQGKQIGKSFLFNQYVYSVSFSPYDQLIASGVSDNKIYLCDFQGDFVGSPFQGHDGVVRSVSFSPNGKWIVSGSDDMTIRLWDLQGNPIGQPFRGHQGGVLSVAFSPDAQIIASCSSDLTVRLWNIEGKPICEPLRGHRKATRIMDWSCVNSVAFSHDGQIIISSGGGEDKTLRLWRANWRSWLDICCNRLRHHPVFTNPDSIEDPEQREIAIAACKTCEKYVWSNAPNSVE